MFVTVTVAMPAGGRVRGSETDEEEKERQAGCEEHDA